LADSEVGDGGAAEMRHLWFFCLLLLELLHLKRGYENHWYHCFAYSFTYLFGELLSTVWFSHYITGVVRNSWTYWNFDAC